MIYAHAIAIQNPQWEFVCVRYCLLFSQTIQTTTCQCESRLDFAPTPQTTAYAKSKIINGEAYIWGPTKLTTTTTDHIHGSRHKNSMAKT